MLSNCSMPDSKNKPGDQANLGKNNGGEEYGLIKWYNKPWSGILRYCGEKQEDVRTAISNCAIAAAKNNHIGYSQSARGTYLTQLKKSNWDPSKITTNCGADCSSSTATNVIAAGHICGVSKLKKSSLVSSSSIVSEYKKLGFKYYTDKKYRNGESNLKPGDILVAVASHVSIYVGNGKVKSSASSTKTNVVTKPNFWKQSDNRWKNKKVGSMTCYTGGCGPTSVANVVGALINGKYNPGVVFDYFKDKGYIIAGAGSTREGITKGLEHYGIKAKDIKYSTSNWSNATSAARAGKWVLSLMSGPSMWTNYGHYVLIYKADKNNVYVSDPSDRDIKKASISQYENHMKSYWIIDISNYGGAVGEGDAVSDSGGNIDLTQAIAKLYTSDNYQWVSDSKTKTEDTFTKYVKEATLAQIQRINSGTPLADNLFKNVIDSIKNFVEEGIRQITLSPTKRKLVKGSLASYPNLVEAPFIEVDLNGITIGGYNHQEDKFPNNIESLNIEKINGRINNYTISIVHQVRAGEDPNFIDSLLSRTGVRNKIKIKYGDSAYGAFFKEEEAYIIDVTYSEDVTSSRINYTIKAVSSVGSIQQAYFNFPGIQSKPSTEIIKMLYTNQNTSKQLLSVLGGMQNKAYILGSGYIPTDDASLWIPGGDNMSLVERLQQLVTYMYDPLNSTASYFLTFEDTGQNNAIFKIKKVQKTGTAADRVKNCYYLDVGYPGESFVTSFNIDNGIYWPIYFKYADNFSEYKYNIDYSGQLISKKVNPLVIDNRYGAIDVERMNWWNFVSSYPISASVTIKGLMKPVILMENVYVYAQFYGKEDLATGLYSITGQQDSISGSGYTTTLQLLRVQN